MIERPHIGIMQMSARSADVHGVAVITSDWSDVPGRLANLSTHPNAGSVFGANGHQWRPEPPLTKDELAELESQLGIDLPREYRAFLLQISRGGAGPAYVAVHRDRVNFGRSAFRVKRSSSQGEFIDGRQAGEHRYRSPGAQT